MDEVAPTTVVANRKRLLDTHIDETFGKMCRRILVFLAAKPSLLVVGGPTGCGKLTAAQHCVSHAGLGLVEIVNQSAAATGIISEIKRSGSMLVTTGDCKCSVIVVSGADGLQSGYADLLVCSRACGKHVIVLVNNVVPLATADATEKHRCSWYQPWSSDALMATLNAVPESGLLTVQEKGALIRHCSDMRQLKLAVETLVGARKLGYADADVLHALLDSPVHQWYNTLEIVKGKRLPAEHHNLGWIGCSYLGGMAAGTLDEAAGFAGNLVVADVLQQSDDCEFSDCYSALVLQSSMPLVTHSGGLAIQKIRLDMPRSNKRARYSFALQTDAV